MNKRDLSIPMQEASVKAMLVALPLVIIQTLIFVILHGIPSSSATSGWLVFAVCLLAGIFAHELIHMFAWAWSARKPLRAFKLGMQWKALTPYAHCKETMDIAPYRVGSVAPGILLGVLPWLVSLVNGSLLWFFFGIMYTSAASGDLLVLWMLRDVKPNTQVEDHPSNAGCTVYEP